MSEDRDASPRKPAHARTAGSLCQACAHVRLITSAKGSTFLLCEVSLVDARFAKYPPQPVVQCSGYAQREP
jgi:hypothetical protein